MKRSILTAITLLSLLYGHANAAPVQLSSIVSNDQVVLIGDTRLQFTQDSSQNTLFIPESQFVPNSQLPSTVKVEAAKVGNQTGLRLTFSEPYTFSLSGDERRLVALPTRVVTASAARDRTLLDTDDRAPLVISLSNASPSAVSAQLTQLYPNLNVVIDDRQRSLLIMATPADRTLIRALVYYLDTPRPQVSFEAEVIEINRSGTQKLGIDYDFLFKLGFRESDIPGGFKLGTFGRSPEQRLALSATINLLKTKGVGQVLAQPRVMTLDGVEANINATQNTPLIITSNNVQSVQNISTGITMNLLPKVAPDGTVEVKVTITVSSPTGLTAQGVPTFSSREATTVVRVRDGEPIVIGGLLQVSDLQGSNRVPLLGDLPLIGGLFRSTTQNSSNTDLVMIVTPRLVINPNKK